MSLVDTESQEFTDAVRAVLDELGVLGQGLVGSVEGDPNGQVPSSAGKAILRADGGAGTTLYVKEADDVAGDTTQGWVPK